VLQERLVKPVGANAEREVDVRVVAATNRDLEAEVERGAFRRDLYYRLNVIQLHIAPLRARKEDVPLLVEHFVRKHTAALGRAMGGIEPEAMAALCDYDFPGNVRELENLIERAVVLAEEDVLSQSDIPERLQESPDVTARVLHGGELSIKKASREIEEALIRRALEKTRGNRTAAARLLEISHRALLYKIKDYGVQ